MKNSLFKYPIFAACLLLGFSSCKTDKKDPCAVDFDQTTLLSNVGNNIIIPTYDKLKAEVTTLSTDTDAFIAGPSNSTLTQLRQSWKTAWMTWQTAAHFDFGPAETQDLRASINNFPLFTKRLQDAIQSGSYDINTNDYSYARGFPALDYLLYGVDNSDATIVSKYTTDSVANNRKQYLKDVVAHIQTKVNTVATAWSATGGNYINTFTTTTGMATGQPMSLLINQLNMNYELIKNDQIGLAAGAKISYLVQPDKVMAYYSRMSKDFILEGLKANKALFQGMAKGTDGIGLDDYIKATEATKGSDGLEVVILKQYDAAIAAMEAINGTWHDALTNNLNGVKAVYAGAQNQVVNIKTDLPAALCVSITYSDKVDDVD